ncbi:beta-glucosidase BglX [Paenibacillus sp. LMG 31459]|uniref:Beta-glucosidase BglX n=1 Tax=Paenibacillus phytohabitans TaxID=2654978 RepID=A0ABX1Y975_9BACL|nr:beta-glucosidase BglX [Paenibacillus phytohabitans]NOU77485.1 beta-glucosidase BglX [Paenibacillus phytohabitans]
MEDSKLQELFDSLTLKEKIYQMVQLSGDFFANTEFVTGPLEKVGLSEEVFENLGSVYNIFGGAKAMKDLQKKYLEHSKHKIPLLFLGDVIYGYTTSFPITLAYGCTWDPEMIENMARIIAKEASVSGIQGTFGPAADLVREPRWGRCLESNGEDPYLNSRYTAAMVKGLQGDLGEDTIASCVKHFAAYGAPIAGREYNSVDMSERTLREVYLPPYKAAVDAGCLMVMPSFNSINGVPSTGNKWLLKDLLRDEWGFEGVTVTDYSGIKELVDHGYAKDNRHAAQLALEATVDIDMRTNCYANELIPLIEEGKVSEDLVNDACWRILVLKNKLGLFEDPYRSADELKEESICNTPEHVDFALKVAEKSIVLLKNDQKVLPLQKEQQIALIGPYADNPTLNGFWSPFARKDIPALKKTLEDKLGAANVHYAFGCPVLGDHSIYNGFPVPKTPYDAIATAEELEKYGEEAVQTAQKSDVIVLALGEHHLTSGEGASKTDISLPKHQIELLKKLKKTGKPIVLVMFNGRPLVLGEEELGCDAIVEAWFPGTAGAAALANILSGETNPSAKLSMTFPRNMGQIPIYYNHLNTGRPAKTSTHSGRFLSRYIDSSNDPMFPFGYGLSYTTFEYSNLTLSSKVLEGTGAITASIEITNTGAVDGEEVIQLYIHDLVGSVVRPVKELKGFQRVAVKANETVKAEFQITEEMLRFYTSDMSYQSEAGDFEVLIGPSSSEFMTERFELIQ